MERRMTVNAAGMIDTPGYLDSEYKMKLRPKWPLAKQALYDRLYLDIAWRFSKMSYAMRLKVGVCLVKDGLVAPGWNGMPAGADNQCEHLVGTEWVTNPEVSHAEENALDKITRSTLSSVGAELYMTHSPCGHCAKQVANSGVVRVLYDESYRSDDGIIYLRNRGVLVQSWAELYGAARQPQ
ncbi:dCMP deaminase [Achromobacter phage Motura]|uniref:dCMP deaminase n=1 Tax=Achromobacter phage Motura TaxID=2591403 RepID=A0A514CSX7_9CAUD|nr:dCMP deaminase [Achromobacter phage Motura]QDH83589.1 dCMP deaminase [Achromobacter phage Motura]